MEEVNFQVLDSFLQSFFPKEKAEAKTKAREDAQKELLKKKIRIPEKNSKEDDPVRIVYDKAYQLAFQTSYEKHFKPIDHFLISIRNFYKVAIAEIRKRFEFDDDAFAVLKLVKPSNARKLLPPSLFDFFQRFPNVKEAVDPEMAEEEWRDHINLPLQLFQITNESAFIEMNPEVYWVE